MVHCMQTDQAFSWCITGQIHYSNQSVLSGIERTEYGGFHVSVPPGFKSRLCDYLWPIPACCTGSTCYFSSTLTVSQQTKLMGKKNLNFTWAYWESVIICALQKEKGKSTTSPSTSIWQIPQSACFWQCNLFDSWGNLENNWKEAGVFLGILGAPGKWARGGPTLIQTKNPHHHPRHIIKTNLDILVLNQTSKIPRNLAES